MGDISVSALLAGGYEYLGRVDQSKLNLGQALAFLFDSIDFYCVDLLISDENWLLKSYTFTPSSKDDDIVTAPGFAAPVLMEIRDVGSTSESDWRGILTANASDVQDMAQGGVNAVAFYGLPAKMRWSFDPIVDRSVEARLWYEPVANQPSSLTDSPKLSQAFAAMLKLKWAWKAVPYCSFTPEEALSLRTALAEDLAGWRAKWDLWVYGDKNARVVQKRDFRGNRRRQFGWGRTGLGWW